MWRSLICFVVMDLFWRLKWFVHLWGDEPFLFIFFPLCIYCLDGLRKNGNIPVSQNMTKNKKNNAGVFGDYKYPG